MQKTPTMGLELLQLIEFFLFWLALDSKLLSKCKDMEIDQHQKLKILEYMVIFH